MSEVRLQKVIAGAGLMSRRAAEELIAAGRVTIDGHVARLGERVDPATARVEIEGVLVPVAPGLVTYLLYKPTGVLSTAADPRGRPTVVQLVPEEPRVVPVGRLDADTEGLILLSNDGELTLRVTHPRFGLTKTYLAEVRGRMPTSAVRLLRAGVELDDGMARVRRARIIASRPESTLVEVVMAEGRKREVRRLLAAVGYPIEKLVRTAIGPITDRKLKAGEWRALQPGEVASLYKAAGTGP
ncbi:MAG TPA: pseudouridine synthase [Acidimicrobiia bacterium]|jgi:pseudouridine synthase